MGTPCSRCKQPNPRSPEYRYCRDCHNAYKREYGPKYSELPPEKRTKAIARAYARVYLKRGLIERGACVDCGSMFAEMHHADYSKPTDVTWLCRPCHMRRHEAA